MAKRKTCISPYKQKHHTKADALEHKRNMVRHGAYSKGLRIYGCADHWHIGHWKGLKK